MNSDQWYYSTDSSNPSGPVRVETLRHLLQDHVLKHDSLVWNPTMPAWTPVYDIPELEGDVHFSPPPLPASVDAAPAVAAVAEPQMKTVTPTQARPDSGDTRSSTLAYPEAPIGIGGWLIIPAINMILGPLYDLGFLVALITLIASSLWEDLATPGTEMYSPGLTTLVPIAMFVLVAGLVFKIVVAVFFFRKKRQAVNLMIVYWALQPCIVLVAGLAAGNVTSGVCQAITGLILSAIWIAYWLKSRRVANTFVN